METNHYTETIGSVYASLMGKRRNLKSTSVNCIVLLLGVAAAFGAFAVQSEQTTSLYLLLALLAGVGVLWGGVGLLFGGRDLIYLPTRSKLISGTLFLRADSLSALLDALSEGNIQRIKQLREESNSGLRLDLLYAADDQFMACQFYRYVPHTYEVASDVYLIPEPRRAELAAYVQALAMK